jgi:trk system potassium uptake protein TrkA
MKLSDVMPVDAIVNRNDALSSMLISTVRYPENTGALALLDQIGAETIQVTIPDDSPAIGVALKDLVFPSGALLGLVRREGKSRDLFIPTGTSSLASGDKVMVFSTLETVNEALEALGVKLD